MITAMAEAKIGRSMKKPTMASTPRKSASGSNGRACAWLDHPMDRLPRRALNVVRNGTQKVTQRKGIDAVCRIITSINGSLSSS